MVDYERYSDKAMRSKPLDQMDELEREYYDSVAEEEAQKLLARLHNSYGAQFAKTVGLKLANKVLADKKTKMKDTEEDETNRIYLGLKFKILTELKLIIVRTQGMNS